MQQQNTCWISDGAALVSGVSLCRKQVAYVESVNIAALYQKLKNHANKLT